MPAPKWKVSGTMAHDDFVSIQCASVEDAERLVVVMEATYTRGQQSVLDTIAKMSGAPVTGDSAHEAFADDTVPASVVDAVAEAIGTSTYDCTRVWEAWFVGTMTYQDFIPLTDDADRLHEIATAAYEAAKGELT